MADAQDEIILCKGCGKKFRPDGFSINRLGIRLKTCIECRDRDRLTKSMIKAGYKRCKKCKIFTKKEMLLDDGSCNFCENEKRENELLASQEKLEKLNLIEAKDLK